MLSIQALYEQYKQDVFLYLVSLTRAPSLAEDLTSETFLGAIRALPRFQGRADIKTWLFSIARHQWYAHLRKQKHQVGFEELAGIYLAQEDAEGRVLQREAAHRVMELLEQESENARQVVGLRIAGYSVYEISQKLGISESSVRVMDFRAKKKIRETIEKEGLGNV